MWPPRLYSQSRRTVGLPVTVVVVNVTVSRPAALLQPRVVLPRPAVVEGVAVLLLAAVVVVWSRQAAGLPMTVVVAVVVGAVWLPRVLCHLLSRRAAGLMTVVETVRRLPRVLPHLW